MNTYAARKARASDQKLIKTYARVGDQGSNSYKARPVQNTGCIAIKTVDEQGIPVPAVMISQNNVLMGQTDFNGEAESAGIPYGTYDLVLMKSGYVDTPLNILLNSKDCKIVTATMALPRSDTPEVGYFTQVDVVVSPAVQPTVTPTISPGVQVSPPVSSSPASPDMPFPLLVLSLPFLALHEIFNIMGLSMQ